MKFSFFQIFVLLLLTYSANAQPAEEIYTGTTIVSGYMDDHGYGPFNIGFSFNYYGNTYNQFYVNTNGLVSFGPVSDFGIEESIPTVVHSNFIAAFWDDLTVDGAGKLSYTTIGAAPHRKLIIQFNNMGLRPFPPMMGSFSVVLYETSDIIRIQYRLISDYTSTRAHGESATIGIENSKGTEGVQYAYHSSSAIETGKAITFTPSGSTYTLDPDAMYEGIFLTSDLALPDPGIPQLLSPPQNAVIGTGQTFTWSDAGNTASYTLLISTSSDLGGATQYPCGSNTSKEVTGLAVDQTYYWGVTATNASGTTWCENKNFTTSSAPPLAAVPLTLWTEQSQDKTIKLNFTGGDAGAKTAVINSLPLQGQLYQYVSGARGSIISSVPATITDPDRNVIYAASGGFGNGVGNFNYKITDGSGNSPEATVALNVSPPGIPVVLYVAKNTNVEIQFDIPMADPAGKQKQFAVTVNGSPATINSAGLKPGDQSTVILTLSTPLAGTEKVLVSYTMGDVSGLTGGLLYSFDDQTVSLQTQLITFPVLPVKVYGNPPFNPGASSTSGLTISYISSNPAAVTSSGSSIIIHSPGTIDIKAYQAGNLTYAPAQYTRSLTINKADQIITFAALPAKTFGEADFNLTATASSSLSVSYSSNNSSVATVTGNLVHIVGAGSCTITASQNGNTNYNAAVDVSQTLVINRINQTVTFGALPVKIYGDPDFTPPVSASSGLPVTLASNNNNVAIVTGGVIHITGAGSCTIIASQSGNASYNAAADVTQTLVVNKINQTITFGALPGKIYGDADFTPAVSASSGLFVILTSDNNSVATVSGGMIHITGAGSCTITASQGGSTNYNAAVEVPQTLVVNKANQTITFGALPGKIYGDADFTTSETASSGLAVVLSSDNPVVAIVSGSTVHIAGAGTATITATQAGNINFNAAIPILQTINVAKKSLTFTAENKTKAYLAVNPALTYSITGFVNGDAAVEVPPAIQTTATDKSSAGDYQITFTGGSDHNYSFVFAPGTLTITKIRQTITISDFPAKLLVGDTYNITATSTSGLPVLFECKDLTMGTISGNQFTGVSKGNVEIRAYNEGDQNYESAEILATIEIFTTHKNIMHLFTPNNDGINDYWELPEMSEWGKCDVKVYGRNGKLVFSDPDYNNLWDGRSNDNPLPEGAYYFIIKTQNDGMKKGTVNLVR